MRPGPVAVLSVVVALLASGAAAAQNRNPGRSSDSDVSYRWVDEHGVVHYGDRVPPEYARTERAVINDKGVVIDRLEAQKTPEQHAAEAERAAALADREQHDRFLLTTYTSVADIERLRDQRVEQIVGQTRAAEQYIETLESRLVGLQARSQMFQPYSSKPDARPMPDSLAEDLVRTLNELRSQRNLLGAKQAERDAVMRQFQSDIDRYQELRAQTAQRGSSR